MELLIWIAFAALAFGLEKIIGGAKKKEQQTQFPEGWGDWGHLPDEPEPVSDNRNLESYSDMHPYEREAILQTHDEAQLNEEGGQRKNSQEWIAVPQMQNSPVTSVPPAPPVRPEAVNVSTGLGYSGAFTEMRSALKVSSELSEDPNEIGSRREISRTSRKMLRLSSRNIRDAIVLTEILGKPKGAA